VAPRIRYARSDGLDIAYAVYGTESPDIVFVPGQMSHFDLNEETPYYRPYLERLPTTARCARPLAALCNEDLRSRGDPGVRR